METLWAPWRMEYIDTEKPDGCIFCLFPAEGRDRERLILGGTRRSIAMLNRFPYNNGHLMVIPRRHTADFTSLDAEEMADLHGLLRTSVAIVTRLYRPAGLNIGMNLGRSAGAGIADHLHWHVVPRWNGDTNFMPVVAETKVMVEHLDASFEKLRPAFDEALGRGG